MRVLHSAALLRPSAGMLNQMYWEQEASDKLGVTWHSRMYCPEGSSGPESVLVYSKYVKACNDRSGTGKVSDWLRLRYRYYQWLLSMKNDYDIFVLRYYVHDLFQLSFIKSFTKPVYLVHHSKEVPELAMPDTLPAMVRSWLEKQIGPCSLNQADGIIGVTKEIIEHELERLPSLLNDKPSFLYPNGILYSGMNISDARESKIQLLFVCSFFESWHGLDLLINDLKSNELDFILNIVGDVHKSDLLNLANDNRVVLHGQLSGMQINKLSEKCHLGLSSFALYRKGLEEACTLKVREYLRMGLPVYSGHSDVFPDEFEFYKVGAPRFKDILKYAKRNSEISKNEVSSSARKYIDKTILLDNLYNLLQQDFDELSVEN